MKHKQSPPPLSCLTDLSSERHSNLLKFSHVLGVPHLHKTKHSLKVRAEEEREQLAFADTGGGLGDGRSVGGINEKGFKGVGGKACR